MSQNDRVYYLPPSDEGGGTRSVTEGETPIQSVADTAMLHSNNSCVYAIYDKVNSCVANSFSCGASAPARFYISLLIFPLSHTSAGIMTQGNIR